MPLCPVSSTAPRWSPNTGGSYQRALVRVTKIELGRFDSKAADPTRFTIYQEVVKNNNSTMVFSATYKFSYPTRHSSSFPHSADLNAKDQDNLDQFKQVEGLKLMLLEKQMEALGNDHPDALMSMENLANTYNPDINHGSASEIDSVSTEISHTQRPNFSG